MKINKKNGFTLVELLVVVAIIALLVAILLPALANAKAQTRTILCASKHRNIFWAWMHYAHDNDGRIMPAWHGWPTDGTFFPQRLLRVPDQPPLCPL